MPVAGMGDGTAQPCPTAATAGPTGSAATTTHPRNRHATGHSYSDLYKPNVPGDATHYHRTPSYHRRPSRRPPPAAAGHGGPTPAPSNHGGPAATATGTHGGPAAAAGLSRTRAGVPADSATAAAASRPAAAEATGRSEGGAC